MKTRLPNENVAAYFANPKLPSHKQYIALRMFFHEGATAKEVAEKCGYTIKGVYSIARDFKKKLESGQDPFFKESEVGRPPIDREGGAAQMVIAYRKKMLSIPEIKIMMDGQGYSISEGTIWEILSSNGFSRLPKRDNETKNTLLSEAGGASTIGEGAKLHQP